MLKAKSVVEWKKDALKLSELNNLVPDFGKIIKVKIDGTDLLKEYKKAIKPPTYHG